VRRHGRILVFAGVLVREDGWLRGIREVVRHCQLCVIGKRVDLVNGYVVKHRHRCLVRHHVDRII
jgi:hypothetical protein